MKATLPGCTASGPGACERARRAAHPYALARAALWPGRQLLRDAHGEHVRDAPPARLPGARRQLAAEVGEGAQQRLLPARARSALPYSPVQPRSASRRPRECPTAQHQRRENGKRAAWHTARRPCGARPSPYPISSAHANACQQRLLLLHARAPYSQQLAAAHGTPGSKGLAMRRAGPSRSFSVPPALTEISAARFQQPGTARMNTNGALPNTHIGK